MVSRVSDTTGHLTAPTPTARLADRPKTRVAKPSVVSPIIFINESPKGENNSKSNSPLKDFLDSPATRREAQNQRLMEQRNQQNRQLKTQLEEEKHRTSD